MLWKEETVGFDSSLRKLSIKSLSTCHILEPILKAG